MLLAVFFVLAPFLAAKFVDYCQLKPRANRLVKIAIGVVCLLFVIDLLSRLAGRPVFGM